MEDRHGKRGAESLSGKTCPCYLGCRPAVNKPAIVSEIIARLDAELRRYAKAAQDAHAEATDEQSRAENKYDTRGLEASYLARGQSRQVAETEQAREQYASLALRAFGPAEPVGVGALVELENDGARSWYFFGSAAGGTEVLCGTDEILVITSQAPLGRLLLGKRQGEQVRLGRAAYRIVQVR